MKILTTQDLPPPPEGKTGWPWETAEPAVSFEGEGWPKFSVVMPSFRYGRYIEEAIRSVLLQGYPYFELIVMDGGSQDETVEILKKYDRFITYWTSEKDEGQTDAINKGFARCTGDVGQWLNADDRYQPGAFPAMAPHFRAGAEWVGGTCRNVYPDGSYVLHECKPVSFWDYLHYWRCGFATPPIYISMDVIRKCLPLSKDLYHVMDIQFFMRILKLEPRSVFIPDEIVYFRYHGGNKTTSGARDVDEFQRVAREESISLPAAQRQAYLRNLEDHLYLQRLMGKDSTHPVRIIRGLWDRPSLARWPLFWKVWAKSLFGENFYSKFKGAAGR